jgi:hypothetical protein
MQTTHSELAHNTFIHDAPSPRLILVSGGDSNHVYQVMFSFVIVQQVWSSHMYTAGHLDSSCCHKAHGQMKFLSSLLIGDSALPSTLISIWNLIVAL